MKKDIKYIVLFVILYLIWFVLTLSVVALIIALVSKEPLMTFVIMITLTIYKLVTKAFKSLAKKLDIDLKFWKKNKNDISEKTS